MDEALYRTMLIDIYGDLLTEKQREYFNLHYNEDMSLSEIASSEGISRQGVWDIIRRAEETLRRMDEKTGLVKRIDTERTRLDEAAGLLAELAERTTGREHELTEKLSSILQELRYGI